MAACILHQLVASLDLSRILLVKSFFIYIFEKPCPLCHAGLLAVLSLGLLCSEQLLKSRSSKCNAVWEISCKAGGASPPADRVSDHSADSQSTRARWNSVDTFMNFAWSASAVVGGFLIDSAGFRITFFITAAMQTVSLVFLFALLPVVGRHPMQRTQPFLPTLHFQSACLLQVHSKCIHATMHLLSCALLQLTCE